MMSPMMAWTRSVMRSAEQWAHIELPDPNDSLKQGLEGKEPPKLNARRC